MAPRKKNQTTAEQTAQEQTTQEQTAKEEATQEKTTQEETTQEETTQEEATQEETTQEEATQEEATQEENGDQEGKPKQEPEWDEFGNIPNPCVYCGPSVRGVARQYTTYQGGIPEPLKEFLREHPAARGLIVPTAKFASIRKRLETNGTAEAIIYKKVKGEL